MANDRILGVLGGMGPLASAQFMLRLTLLTPADRDQDHIPAVLWSDPRVPDRTRGKSGDGPDPLPETSSWPCPRKNTVPPGNSRATARPRVSR